MKLSSIFVLLLAFLVGGAFLMSCQSSGASDAEEISSEQSSVDELAFHEPKGADDFSEQDDFPEVCSVDEVACGDTAEDCVDLSSSTQHCGACGRMCFSNQECSEGTCTGVGVLTAQELQEALADKDFILINVRVPASELIPGTDASIPHNRIDLMLQAIGEDRDRRAILYCGTATRIQVALRLLQEKGYRNLSVLDSGITGWKAAGYPTVSG